MITRFASFTKVLAKHLGLSPTQLDQAFAPCSLDEIAEVSALRRDVFCEDIDSNDEAYLRWRYFARLGVGSSLLRLRHQGRIIAALGTEPIVVQLGDRQLTGVKCTDAIVAPDFDGRGVGAWMNLHQLDRHDIVVAVGGNPKSLSLLNKIFVGLPVRNTYYLPLLPGSVWARRKSESKLRRVIAPVLDILWRPLTRAWLELVAKRRNGAIRIFDDVAELASRIVPFPPPLASNSILRTPDYLRWRYSEQSGNQYLLLGLEKGSTVSAYLIGRISYSNGPDAPFGLILDWGFDSGTEGQQQFARLIREFSLQVLATGAESVQIVLNDKHSQQVASKLGFIHRGKDARFFVFARDKALTSLTDPKRWFVTLGDSDGV